MFGVLGWYKYQFKKSKHQRSQNYEDIENPNLFTAGNPSYSKHDPDGDPNQVASSLSVLDYESNAPYLTSLYEDPDAILQQKADDTAISRPFRLLEISPCRLSLFKHTRLHVNHSQ